MLYFQNMSRGVHSRVEEETHKVQVGGLNHLNHAAPTVYYCAYYTFIHLGHIHGREMAILFCYLAHLLAFSVQKNCQPWLQQCPWCFFISERKVSLIFSSVSRHTYSNVLYRLLFTEKHMNLADEKGQLQVTATFCSGEVLYIEFISKPMQSC